MACVAANGRRMRSAPLPLWCMCAAWCSLLMPALQVHAALLSWSSTDGLAMMPAVPGMRSRSPSHRCQPFCCHACKLPFNLSSGSGLGSRPLHCISSKYGLRRGPAVWKSLYSTLQNAQACSSLAKYAKPTLRRPMPPSEQAVGDEGQHRNPAARLLACKSYLKRAEQGRRPKQTLSRPRLRAPPPSAASSRPGAEDGSGPTRTTCSIFTGGCQRWLSPPLPPLFWRVPPLPQARRSRMLILIT